MTQSFMQNLLGRPIVLGAVFALFANLMSVQAANVLAGKILLIKGDVFILDSKANIVADPSGKRGRKTDVGSEFFVGETISTKPGARVKLQFIEGANEVVLGSDTTMLVERAGNGADKRGTSLNLSKGEVRSDVKVKYSGQGSDVYEIKSKNAVAGVRGTIFTAIYNPATSKFTIATEKGAVAVSSLLKGAASAQLVTAGKFSSTNGDFVVAPAPLASNPELSTKVEALSGNSPSEKSSDPKSGAASSERNDSGDRKADDKNRPVESGSSEKKSETKSEAKSETKSEAKSEAKSETKSDSRVEATMENKADSKSTVKSGPKLESKSEARVEAKSSQGAAVSNDKGAAPAPALSREMVSVDRGSSASTSNTRAPASAINSQAPSVLPKASIMGSSGPSNDSFLKPPTSVPNVLPPGLIDSINRSTTEATKSATDNTLANPVGKVSIRIGQ